MYFKILKKDLKRKKTLNVILLLFVILATTFVSSSVNVFLAITNGIEYFTEISEAKDYIIFTSVGDTENEEKIEKYLKSSAYVDEYFADQLFTVSAKSIERSDKTELEYTNGTIVFDNINTHACKMFDENDKEITAVKEGEIYIPSTLMKANDLKVGDSIYVKNKDGYRKELKIVGKNKDAYLGSEFANWKRVLVNENEYQEFFDNCRQDSVMLYSVNTNDLEKFKKDFSRQDFNTLVSLDRGMIKTGHLFELVVVAVMLVVSICLVIISAVMLRFIIMFTVNEDLKEIGIMKAIGIPNNGMSKHF